MTSHQQPPFKLLEINVISAQDLPPVSKMLRTFAVAYIHPDHKLTTRVDHHGHTNPTWNYKIVFHVDDRFLKNESSGVTIEIYNVAWLRDLPIGTTRLFINNLSPPLQKNAMFRRVALQICRPSGHLQGILNVGVQLVDDKFSGGEMSVPVIRNVEQLNPFQDPYQEEEEEEKGYNYIKGEEDWMEKEEKGSRSEKGNVSPTLETIKAHKLEPEPETKTVITSNGSLFSAMRPLPSEVAEDLKKGLYYAADEYGSSIFENWTEKASRSTEDIWPVGSKSEDFHGLVRSKSVKWGTDDKIPLRSVYKKPGPLRRGRSENGKGLLSCFGNAYGFQFSFICGSNAMKKKKNRNVKPNNVHLMSLPLPQENLRRFYV